MTLSYSSPERATARQAASEKAIYFRHWLKAPLSMGSVAPASVSLCRLVTANIVREPGEFIVETGGGTGAVSRALLSAGVPAERLIVVEIDPDLAAHLRSTHSEVAVIQGDARKLQEILPQDVVGRVGTVICGIPLTMLPIDIMRPIVNGMLDVMPPGRRFLHYSFCITSPLPYKRLGLKSDRLGFTLGNFPPASLWGYKRLS